MVILGKDAEPCFYFACAISHVILRAPTKQQDADCFENSEFILVLAYMVDIFNALNNLNQQMQGGAVTSGRTSEDFSKKMT